MSVKLTMTWNRENGTKALIVNFFLAKMSAKFTFVLTSEFAPSGLQLASTRR